MYLYPVSKFKLLPRLQAMVQVALGNVAGEADDVGDAAPGFEADEGAAGFVGGPEAVGFGLVAADRHVRALVFVEERHAFDRAMLEHEGVDGESVGGNGQEAVGIDRHRLLSGQFHEEAAVQAVAEHGMLDGLALSVETLEVTMHRVRLVVVREHDCRVRSDLEMNIPTIGVQHLPFSVEALSFSAIAYRQFKLERIFLQRAAGKHIPVPYLFELRITGKAVLSHRVLLAVDAEYAAEHLTDHREEDRRPPAPERRVAMPQIFTSVQLKRLQLGAVIRYFEFNCHYFWI